MEVELLCEGRKFTFSGDESDSYFKVWRDLGFYGGQRDVVPYRLVLKSDSVSVDIGGNIGLTAVLTGALCPAGKGYFFEPDPRNFKHLSRTIEANGLMNFVAYNMAVGENVGTLKFNQMHASGHAAQFDTPNAIEVPMISLDSWAANIRPNRIDFLKIDVEGYERSVLRGGRDTITRYKPVALIEFNSLTTIMVGRILPYDLLDDILALFPIVNVIDLYTGMPRRLGRTPHEINSFVGENLQNGFVHDLLCYFDEDQVKATPASVPASG